MKKIPVVLLSAILLMVAMADTARAGFGTGLVVGMVISNGKTVVGSNDSNVLYVLPGVNERVKDPLKMKMAATYTMSFAPKSSHTEKSLEELFKETVTGSDRYVILQATRVFEPRNILQASIWFVYIEKELVVPLEKLPQEKKK